MFESLFILDGKFREQRGDVAIDSSLGPTIADVFMFHFEKKSLEKYPVYFKAIASRRFIDDTFLFFRTKDHGEKFK